MKKAESMPWWFWIIVIVVEIICFIPLLIIELATTEQA